VLSKIQGEGTRKGKQLKQYGKKELKNWFSDSAREKNPKAKIYAVADSTGRRSP
jgi:hypothetical protein